MSESVLPDLRVPAPAGAEAGVGGEAEAVASRDPFGPPRTPVEVGCLHCGQRYRSDRIWFDEDAAGPPGPDGRRGFWACPTDGCGGIGFTCDIWPTDPEYRDEATGEKYWIEDPDDEGDGAWDGPEFDGSGSGFDDDVPF
ncbi:hypothetical protein [Alienimonas sp. DA493]|uniref:hypothetical protein n=1 Tax=Alienimonas sp. DA493 TaxID=3373605 RepID=UPI0037551FB1